MDHMCQTCNSVKIITVTAKCDVCQFIGIDFIHSGYVPYNAEIGGGNHIDFAYCLDCGQIQGSFPVDENEIEID